MSSPYAAMKIRDFRRFVSARFCITLAIQIQAVVVGWQVYEITHDPLSLGLIGLAEAVPSIGVSLYAGHIADILSRKRIIFVTAATLVFCSASLLLLTIDVHTILVDYGVLPIYTVIFISGIARGFITPAVFSFMPQLIPRELYQNAITWNSTLWEMASIGGPPIGGLIYGFFGITAAYAVDASLLLIGLLLVISIPDRPLPPPTEEQGVVEKIKAGLQFVFSNKIILGAISLDLLPFYSAVLSPCFPFLPTKSFTSERSGLAFSGQLPVLAPCPWQSISRITPSGNEWVLFF